MAISFWVQLFRRRPLWRVVPLILTLLIGWSSVEVLWSGEDASRGAVVLTAPDSERDPPSDEDEDCHCLCACDCRAVHVVPAALPQASMVARDLQRPELGLSTPAPPGRPAEPPIRPPRNRA